MQLDPGQPRGPPYCIRCINVNDNYVTIILALNRILALIAVFFRHALCFVLGIHELWVLVFWCAKFHKIIWETSLQISWNFHKKDVNYAWTKDYTMSWCIQFAYDPHTLYNPLNVRRLTWFQNTWKYVNQNQCNAEPLISKATSIKKLLNQNTSIHLDSILLNNFQCCNWSVYCEILELYVH